MSTTLSPLNLPQPVSKLRLGLYAGVHLLFCQTYFWLLWLADWFWLLAAIIILTSLWAARDSHNYLSPTLRRPWLWLVSCWLVWPLAFPLYLTCRQWQKLRYGLKAIHSFNKKTAPH